VAVRAGHKWLRHLHRELRRRHLPGLLPLQRRVLDPRRTDHRHPDL